ncbi:MAG: exodeoxyribonuclease VII large subunit [Candidatus Pacebacteria bacterium]|nr:exodeoxyribonuclease VII large subunit [Candidatus Paceibacterota bacterium]
MSQKSLFDQSPEVQPVFSVGEFLDFINELVGQQSFSVQGEVVSARPHPTGMYFSLKDAEGGGVMDCYMSPFAYRGLGVAIEDGMHVKVSGVPSIYKAKGRFSFRVESLEFVGEGTLKKAYEALKIKLTGEGIFARKRELPEFISSIGLITSKTGAVIDDFRKNLARLGYMVYHRDVRVEGAVAVAQVTAAIEEMNRSTKTIDVIVLIRGGGSMEDLQAFNNEGVVRAVFGSRIPTIVSIGHDRDVPLAQMAADASASTPTATAVLINATWDRLQSLSGNADELVYRMDRVLRSQRALVDSAWHRLDGYLQRVMTAGVRLQDRMRAAMVKVRQSIDQIAQLVTSAERTLTAVNPERQLRLGYSIVTGTEGKVVRAVSAITSGDELTIRIADGSLRTVVKEVSINT